MDTLNAMTERGQIGTLTIEGSKITGSTAALQEIADSRIRREGHPRLAWASLRGWSNGYLTFVPAEAGETCVATQNPDGSISYSHGPAQGAAGPGA